MWKTLSFLQKNLIWTIPFMMILGLISGYFFEMGFIKIAVIPLTFLMVYPMMVNLQIEKVFSLEGMKVQAVTQFINFAVIPLIAFALGNYFFPESPMIVLGLLFAALLPTSGMTISWTGFAKGNMNAAIKMTVIGLIIGSLATPLYAKWLMGETIDMPMGKIFTSIAVVVFLPMIFGYLTKVLIVKFNGNEKYQKDIKQKFPPISTLGVLGIVFVAMSLKSASIISNPAILLSYLFPIVILYSINLIISTIVGKLFFNRGDAIALVYGTVMRNLSIALAIAMTAFKSRGSEIAIIIAISYIVQVQSAAWYVKFTDKIFGSVKEMPQIGRVQPAGWYFKLTDKIFRKAS
ncbi:MAG: arsenic resistance protein [Melioribacteraceae bacterium]|nr:arsenic resistance protein [Melioribacteraceae bacterium]